MEIPKTTRVIFRKTKTNNCKEINKQTSGFLSANKTGRGVYRQGLLNDILSLNN
jgi:hypothetical protein